MIDALMVFAAVLFALAGVFFVVAVALFVRLRAWEAAAFLWKRRRKWGVRK